MKAEPLPTVPPLHHSSAPVVPVPVTVLVLVLVPFPVLVLVPVPAPVLILVLLKIIKVIWNIENCTKLYTIV